MSLSNAMSLLCRWHRIEPRIVINSLGEMRMKALRVCMFCITVVPVRIRTCAT